MNSYKFDGFSLKNTIESHKEFNEFLKSRITFTYCDVEIQLRPSDDFIIFIGMYLNAFKINFRKT